MWHGCTAWHVTPDLVSRRSYSHCSAQSSQAHVEVSQRALRADYSAYLKSIPAAASECSARYALEPSQIARLGLADAERARQLQPDEPAAHLCRAQALLLLEEYAAAEEALLYTLSLDAHSSQAQVCS